MKVMTRNIDEVSFIRPILIVLLVLYHAFAPWCGAWRPFSGYCDRELYWWVGTLARSFMLPMFVFISSYIWAYQREDLGRKDSLWQLCVRKFKRLIVPSVIFSVIYFLTLANPVDFGKSFGKITMDILGGYAHMWFLPMLFLCFMECWVLLRVKSRTIRWLFVVIAFCCSIVYIPLEVSNSFYYLLYFYAGYEAWNRRDSVISSISATKVVILWIVFLLAFVSLTLINREVSEYIYPLHGPAKAAGLLLVSVSNSVYALLGVQSLFATAVYWTSRHKLGPFVINIGAYCLGVYIFQQFVLSALYYKTALPDLVGDAALPWIGFIAALPISLCLSYLLRQTKLGRNLI